MGKETCDDTNKVCTLEVTRYFDVTADDVLTLNSDEEWVAFMNWGFWDNKAKTETSKI